MPRDGTPIIEFLNVSFAHGHETIFDALSFPLERSGFYLVTGPSGIGKSTLLRLMNRLETPNSGDIFLEGRPLSDLLPQELRSRVMYLHQTPIIVDGTIRENLTFPFHYKANKSKCFPGDDLLRKYLDRLNLSKLPLDKTAGGLSVGQAQRICLIRAFLLDPQVLLLDEPTSALDPQSAKCVDEFVEEACIDYQKTLVIVTHKEFVPRSVPVGNIDLSENGCCVTPPGTI